MAGFDLETSNGKSSGKESDKKTDLNECVSVKDRTWRHWLIVVVAFLYFFGMYMGLFIITQYIYRRVQMKEYTNITFVAGISYCITSSNVSVGDLQRLAHVQEEASTYHLVFSIVASVPSIAINIIFGSYTDTFGRKFLMLVAMTGSLLRILICVLGVYTTMDIKLFGVAFAVEGLCGQGFAWILASFAFVADVTNKKTRAIGIVLNEFGIGLGGALATLIGGFYLQAYGFTGPLLVSAALVVVAILVTVFILPESYPKEKRTLSSDRCDKFRHAFEFYYSSWNYGLRWKYILSILVFFFTMFTALGRMNIETLYQLNAPFCWTPKKLGLFAALRTSLLQVVGMMAVGLLKIFFEDDSIAIIGSVSFAAGYIIEGLAENDMMIYLVSVVGSLGLLTVPMIRSIMSRMTSSDRQGAVAASLSIVETTCHMVSNVVLSAIYRETVAKSRGATFFVMAAFNIASLLLLLFLKFGSRKKDVEKHEEMTQVRPVSYIDKTHL